jgi:NAD-dependent DNA ligase
MTEPVPQTVARLEDLKKILHHHNYRDYVLDAPGITEFQYFRKTTRSFNTYFAKNYDR